MWRLMTNAARLRNWQENVSYYTCTWGCHPVRYAQYGTLAWDLYELAVGYSGAPQVWRTTAWRISSRKLFKVYDWRKRLGYRHHQLVQNMRPCFRGLTKWGLVHAVEHALAGQTHSLPYVRAVSTFNTAFVFRERVLGIAIMHGIARAMPLTLMGSSYR